MDPLKIIVILGLASTAMAEIATLGATFASWPMAKKAYIELIVVLTTQLKDNCKGIKCDITIRACKIEDKFEEIIDIPDECKKYVGGNKKRALDNELTPATCVEKSVDINTILGSNGYYKLDGLEGNTMYAIELNEIVGGVVGAASKPYMIQTPSTEGKGGIRRTKKGFEMDSQLGDQQETKTEKRKLLLQLLKRLLEEDK